MASKGLTDATAKATKPGATARDIADGDVPGLSLRVLPSGRKSWTLRVRSNGKPVRVHLGEYPGTTLSSARDLAREARRLAGRGENPEHAVRPPLTDPGMTVADAIQRWLDSKAGNRSLAMEKRRMALHVTPTLGGKPVRDVTRGDLAALLHDMAFDKATPKPVEANRTFGSLRNFFGWCAAQDIRPDDPTSLMKRPVKVEPSAQRQREGTVSLLGMADLARLWRAAPAVNSSVLGDLLRCLLLVPLRRDEWTDLGWSELHGIFTADGWTGTALRIGGERMKARRPAIVPLPPQAVTILRERKKITGRGAYIFAVPGREKPFAGWKRAAATLRGLLTERQADWSPHTIRKSVATAMVRDLGADELLVGRILQHSPRAALGITAVYQRSDRLKEQADLLARWATHLEAVAADLERQDTENAPGVVPLRVGGKRRVLAASETAEGAA